MTVEALLAGARLVLVNRSTFNEQPVTTFGLLNRERMSRWVISSGDMGVPVMSQPSLETAPAVLSPSVSSSSSCSISLVFIEEGASFHM